MGKGWAAVAMDVGVGGTAVCEGETATMTVATGGGLWVFGSDVGAGGRAAAQDASEANSAAPSKLLNTAKWDMTMLVTVQPSKLVHSSSNRMLYKL